MLVAAVFTDIQVAAENGGATLRDVGEHAMLRGAQVPGALERGAMPADDFGKLEAGRPSMGAHLLPARRR